MKVELASHHVNLNRLTFQHNISVWRALEKAASATGESIPLLDGRGYFIGLIYQSALVAAYLDTSEGLRAEEHAVS